MEGETEGGIMMVQLAKKSIDITRTKGERRKRETMIKERGER